MAAWSVWGGWFLIPFRVEYQFKLTFKCSQVECTFSSPRLLPWGRFLGNFLNVLHQSRWCSWWCLHVHEKATHVIAKFLYNQNVSFYHYQRSELYFCGCSANSFPILLLFRNVHTPSGRQQSRDLVLCLRITFNWLIHGLVIITKKSMVMATSSSVQYTTFDFAFLQDTSIASCPLLLVQVDKTDFERMFLGFTVAPFLLYGVNFCGHACEWIFADGWDLLTIFTSLYIQSNQFLMHIIQG